MELCLYDNPSVALPRQALDNAPPPSGREAGGTVIPLSFSPTAGSFLLRQRKFRQIFDREERRYRKHAYENAATPSVLPQQQAADGMTAPSRRRLK